MDETGTTPPDEAIETAPKTAEAVGAERLDTMREMAGNAKEAIVAKWDSARANVAKAGKFLGRLGLGILGADVAAKNVGVAAGEAGMRAGKATVEFAKSDAAQTVEDYKYVSGAVKGKATELGNQTKEVWGRAVEKKNQILAAADAKAKEIHLNFETKRQETRARITNEKYQKKIDDLAAAEASLAEQLVAVKGMIAELQAGRGGMGVAA